MHKQALMTLLAAAALSAITGCADVPRTETASADKGEVITGSNIPRKRGNAGPSGVTTIDGDAVRAGALNTNPQMPAPAPGAGR